MEKQTVILRFLKTLLDRVESYKEEMGLVHVHKGFFTYYK